MIHDEVQLSLFVIKNHAKEMNTNKLHAQAVLYLEQTQHGRLDTRLDGFKTWLDVVKYRTPISILHSWALVSTATDSLVQARVQQAHDITCYQRKPSNKITLNLLVTLCINKFNIQQLYVLTTLYLCVV
jgi:hypothetical protein